MKIIFSILAFACALTLHAQRYSPVDEQSSIKFSIKNFGIATSGTFKGLTGEIYFDANNLSASFFKANVNAASINTGISARDNHLKKEEYFDAANYPLISFSSLQITATANAGNYLLKGTVNIKGVSKEISFLFTATPINDGIKFTGLCKLNRRDFNVGGKSFVLSDDVTVTLSVFAKKS
ncbi:MAG TPA: YceI family protein [Chitinophagaceae bacterium]|nr:YceI family protein [Chitinophagaceae bacterium]